MPCYHAVFDKAVLGSEIRLFNAGCGARGLALTLAADPSAQVAGMDASEALLAVARARLPAVRLGQSDLEALPFADGSLDAVSGVKVFEYAADPLIALREAHRVTRAGGKPFITR